MSRRFRVEKGARFRLSSIDPADTTPYAHHDEAAGKLEADLKRLTDLQERFYADRRHALLVVLQAIDTGGKDGTIKHVFSGLNPQGVSVTSFKAPSQDELDRPFLWRINQALPARGQIAIFNRSHYESVLVVRVHELVPPARWQERYAQINDFERELAGEGATILKFFLLIDREEQARRLQDRLADPTKRWKFQLGDVAERKRWSDYLAAYEDVLTRCSTDVAPWYLVPANHKWFRNLAVGSIIADRLEALRPRYPDPPDLPRTIDLA